MKIRTIEIEGFGPFRGVQRVDLDRYAGDGIFLISGRTGAGKSSILDAICFALYGSTPRYSDGEKRLRSDYAAVGEPTRVALEFEVGDGAWRIERTPEYERPKQRGEGTTTERASVELFERVGSAWHGVAAKEREVGARVIDIVGMSSDQFQQVILLAQGRFARFLLAKDDERRRLLRSLFGTHRFGDYEEALDARRREAEAAVGERTGALRALLDQAGDAVERALAGEEDDAAGTEAEGDEASTEPPAPDDWAGRIALLEAARAAAGERRASATARAAEAEASSDAAAAADDLRRAVADKQRSRGAARERIAALDAAREETEAARAELAEARRAEGVRASLDAVVRADEKATTAAAAERDARAAWAAARGGAEASDAAEAEQVAAAGEAPDSADAERPRGHTGAGTRGDAEIPAADAAPDALDAFDAAMHRKIGGWEPLRERESELARDAVRIDEQREALAALVEAISARDKRAGELPALIATARDHRDRAKERADGLGAVDEHIRALEAQFAAAHEVRDLADAYAAAESGVREAKAAAGRADAALDELHRRRLAGYSSELAQGLVPGEPCAVCGATEHPAPAEIAEDHVSPEQIDEADAARAEAATAHDAALERRRQAELALTDAQKRSEGRTETEIDGDLLAARERRAEAQTAAKEHEAYARRLAELEAERDEITAAANTASGEKGALESSIKAAEDRLADARSAVDAARGAFGSVAERIGAAQRLASLARACAAAARDAARAATAAADSRSALEAALAEAGFATGDGARAALRAAEAIRALEKSVGEADTARAAAERALAELAEAELPDEPVDREETRAALAAAREAYSRAVAARSDAEHLASTLGAALDAATKAHDAIAERAEEAAAIKRLADTVAGRPPNDRRMNLETFVLAAELEEIVQAANHRLAAMSDNQYTLRHTDQRAYRNAASGLGLEVFDAHTGRARPPHSLSGGETFLASLALALGLAEVVTGRSGGIRLDTLFIDEGFGSLDSETLEVAMRTLDDLRQGGRTIGLISHVEQMKEQIPSQLRVEQTPQGWSVVRQE
ncbi:AAA family ATPase [Microbacterium halophytorum]|uniref:AAA family ATPase n=1 Tax=Microbacterium halophytorum TaxID=2067568 RepID=UPI000CFBA800|nr:SMC family ATPase [Microbacterium halophytorum]